MSKSMETSRILSDSTFPDEPPPSPRWSRDPRWLIAVIPKRYFVVLLSMLGFVNAYSMRVDLSVAIVAMVKEKGNDTNETSINHRYDWSSQLQGSILASFFYGYIVTQIPGGWLAGRLGGKRLFGGGILCSSLLTLFTPIAAEVSPYFLIAIRVLTGLCQGVTFPSMHSMLARWSPKMERARMVTISHSGCYIGTVIALPLAGHLADAISWQSIFYVIGSIGIVWCAVWFWFVYDDPRDHPTITEMELQIIQSGIGVVEPPQTWSEVPWRCVFTSPAVWAVVAAHFSTNWGFYTMLTELPTYLEQVMGFSLTKTGFLAAMPYLVMAVLLQVFGHAADWTRRRLSVTVTLKIFTSVGLLIQMAFILTTAYLTDPNVAVACLTIAVGFGGMVWSGFGVNHIDLAPQFAGILFGVSNLFATISGIVSPMLTGAIVQNNSVAEWRVIFYIAASIYGFGAIFYTLFASGQRQEWAPDNTGYQQVMAALGD